LLGKNSIVKAGAQLIGSVIIADDCVVHEGAKLENCIVWSGSQIGSNAVVKDAVLGKKSRLESGVSQIGHASIPSLAELA
jgi:NDP-sugar pyrophosphorylase family protein